MTLRTILTFPDPQLRTKASEVKEVNKTIQSLVDDMLETMYEAEGIGLAATQINVHKRVVVIDVSEERNEPLVLINPHVQVINNEPYTYSEGCLSVPSFYEDITRAQTISVSALDKQGKPFNFEAEGLLAVCVQHELDHLNGKLFVDQISSLKRDRIRKKLIKQQNG